jgi:DNA-binding MarR family transcriptional regulator/GNAT superfamily N-acetyltransferase
MAAADERVHAVRRFNRRWTGVIGVLGEGVLGSPYTLTEARVLFELAQGEVLQVAGLRAALGLDAGYLSRILARFEREGLATRARAAEDGRRQEVRLTSAGRAAFAEIDQRSAADIRGLLEGLGEDGQQRALAAMGALLGVLDRPAQRTVLLREPEPGDLGWIVQAHGRLYAQEYAWDATFEALVARIVGEFAAAPDPRRERAWIAEVDGVPAGCILCVAKDEQVAQLRLLLVEPWARGLGIGGRLVGECVRFARAAGYRELVLWTNDVLTAARRIYERSGFRLLSSDPHHSFGHDLVGQYWSLDLTSRSGS